MRIYVDADACPVKEEIYRVAGRHRLPVVVVAVGFIRVPQDPLIERVAAGGSPGRRRQLDRGARRARRYRDHRRCSLSEPLRESRRRGHRAERTAVHRRIDRDDFGGAQPDARSALGRRGDRRAATVFATRPLGVPVGARRSDPPPSSAHNLMAKRFNRIDARLVAPHARRFAVRMLLSRIKRIPRRCDRA